MAASSSSLSLSATPSPSQTKFPPSHLHLSPKAHKPKTTSLVVSSAQQQQPGPPSSSAAVTCPSLANPNVISAYNVQVIVDEGESEERLLNWFRREVKRRRYFEKSRNKRRRTFSKPPLMQNRLEVPVQKEE